MPRTTIVLPLLAALLTTGSAHADEPAKAPAANASSSSTWFLAGGGVLAGLGVVNLATAPLCKLSAIRASAQPACIGTSIGVGAALLGAGVPLIVIGVQKRNAVQVAPTVGGASVVWSGSF